VAAVASARAATVQARQWASLPVQEVALAPRSRLERAVLARAAAQLQQSRAVSIPVAD
jgi:hypothetical protein